MITLQENNKMTEDDDGERSDNVPPHSPNSHSEITISRSYRHVECLHHVLIDRLILANPMAEAPRTCTIGIGI